MADILAEICAAKRAHIAQQKARYSLTELESTAKQASPPRGFTAALQQAVATGQYGLICEIKKASPSKGLIRADFDPPALAKAYAAGGASCLSVLTDTPYFQGRDAYLRAARQACALPCLRKDFMLDPYQVTESRALGADAILIIMAAVDDGLAGELEAEALHRGMDCLVEVHNQTELARAKRLRSPLIGINNRNLKTMTVSLDTVLSLAPTVGPGRLAVAESGLAEPEDLARCAAAGAACFLIGESFMRQSDVTAAVRAFQRPESLAKGSLL